MAHLRPYDGLENFVRPADLSGTFKSLRAEIVEHRGIHLLPFQIAALHPLLRLLDRYGQTLLPLMINQCIHVIKPE
jgi:hypothetical protein